MNVATATGFAMNAVCEPSMVSVVALCVPESSSTSCDQAVLVDQATDASLRSDAVVLKVGRFG